VGDAGGRGAVKKRPVQAAWMVGGGVGTALPNLPVLEKSRAAPLSGTAGPASAPRSAVGRPARRTPGLSSAKTDQPDASSYALDSPCAAYPGGRCSAGTAGCASECYIRVASCLRVTGRSTRHDPLPRAPPHGQTRPARSLYQPKASWRRCAVRLTVPPPSGVLAATG
jgi:hypothetical protein